MTNIKEEVLKEMDLQDVKNTLSFMVSSRAIDLTLAEVGKVIDGLSFSMDKASIQIKGSKLVITEELKQKLGIK